mmetsp:Transcript_10403/g.43043  ORF Transcript_10403/g.43043 Transcript_10403/m.43043 type:complete len:202 (+) Transcript_10403:264-869(+)
MSYSVELSCPCSPSRPRPNDDSASSEPKPPAAGSDGGAAKADDASANTAAASLEAPKGSTPPDPSVGDKGISSRPCSIRRRRSISKLGVRSCPMLGARPCLMPVVGAAGAGGISCGGCSIGWDCGGRMPVCPRCCCCCCCGKLKIDCDAPKLGDVDEVKGRACGTKEVPRGCAIVFGRMCACTCACASACASWDSWARPAA